LFGFSPKNTSSVLYIIYIFYSHLHFRWFDKQFFSFSSVLRCVHPGTHNLCPKLGPTPIRDPGGKRNPCLIWPTSQVHMLDARIYNIFYFFVRLLFYFRPSCCYLRSGDCVCVFAMQTSSRII